MGLKKKKMGRRTYFFLARISANHCSTVLPEEAEQKATLPKRLWPNSFRCGCPHREHKFSALFRSYFLFLVLEPPSSSALFLCHQLVVLGTGAAAAAAAAEEVEGDEVGCGAGVAEWSRTAVCTVAPGRFRCFA
ncbi:UNVERIFIED_CONTAM: hypothetical protein FKN15_034383 [Acipenser sinensis]